MPGEPDMTRSGYVMQPPDDSPESLVFMLETPEGNFSYVCPKPSEEYDWLVLNGLDGQSVVTIGSDSADPANTVLTAS